MANGYWQKILRVNVTNQKSTVESIAENDLKDFIGGAGLGAEILRRELPEKIEPYDPRNLVIFATGPFQGPAVPGGAKFNVVDISPLTRTFADSAAGKAIPFEDLMDEYYALQNWDENGAPTTESMEQLNLA
jgi:aldehyde:ferredoxin oxidoreductase